MLELIEEYKESRYPYGYVRFLEQKVNAERLERTKHKEPNAPVSLIMSEVCLFFGLSPEELQGKTRKNAVSQPRQVVHALAMEMTEYTSEEIGIKVGNLGGATVRHSLKKHKDLREVDKLYRATTDKIKGSILKIWRAVDE